MTTKKQQCPEFPYFGANYPDARCIDGYLYDMDYCGENGELYDNGDKIPCPFCNKKEFFEYHGDDEDSGVQEIYDDIKAWVKKHYPEYKFEE